MVRSICQSSFAAFAYARLCAKVNSVLKASLKRNSLKNSDGVSLVSIGKIQFTPSSSAPGKSDRILTPKTSCIWLAVTEDIWYARAAEGWKKVKRIRNPFAKLTRTGNKNPRWWHNKVRRIPEYPSSGPACESPSLPAALEELAYFVLSAFEVTVGVRCLWWWGERGFYVWLLESGLGYFYAGCTKKLSIVSVSKLH